MDVSMFPSNIAFKYRRCKKSKRYSNNTISSLRFKKRIVTYEIPSDCHAMYDSPFLASYYKTKYSEFERKANSYRLDILVYYVTHDKIPKS